MDRTTGLGVLRMAAGLIASGTPDVIGSVWNVTDGFLAARNRVLPRLHTKPARTYLQLVDALAGVGESDGKAELYDAALLSLCIADLVGLDAVIDSELTSAMRRLFEPPLAKPGAFDTFQAIAERTGSVPDRQRE
jgi:hypothetical protein